MNVPPSPAPVHTSLVARLLTASLLIPVLLGALWFGSTLLVAALFGAFLWLAAREWASLSGFNHGGRLLYATFILALALGSAALLTQEATRQILLGACLWWGVAALLIGWAQRGGSFPQRLSLVIALIGCVVMVPAYLALMSLFTGSREHLVALFLLVWAADSVAYFAGRAWGRAKLANRVSPGKTWVGVGASLVSALAIGAGFAFVAKLPMVATLGIAVVTVVISIVGDLTESFLKRREGLKDSGSLLPGHGGVLDRIDSLLAAAPVYAITLSLVTSPA